MGRSSPRGYNGSANRWGFAIHLASNGKYEDSTLPTGDFTGSPEAHPTQYACSISTAPPHDCSTRNDRDVHAPSTARI